MCVRGLLAVATRSAQTVATVQGGGGAGGSIAWLWACYGRRDGQRVCMSRSNVSVHTADALYSGQSSRCKSSRTAYREPRARVVCARVCMIMLGCLVCECVSDGTPRAHTKRASRVRVGARLLCL